MPGNAGTSTRRRSAGPRRATAVETGTLTVLCTPWCIPYVDHQVRGKDGRSFPLAVPAGTHQIEVRRLDDRQQREVVIRPGEPQTLRFTFE
jgi:hypothetical protein